MSGSGSGGTVTGSCADMVSRMRAVLPPSWFPLTAPGATSSATPVLDGVLSGIGYGWAYCHAFIQFVAQQSRLSSAAGSFLDMICVDFFGTTIKRMSNEADDRFRGRIRTNLLLPRATRLALSQAITALLGVPPTLFEPFRAADTGGYGGAAAPSAGGGGGYATAGMRLGSSIMPFQYLVEVTTQTAVTRRESDASFIDANGFMQVAARHVLRPLHGGGSAGSALVEPRGFNLIKDSIGWGGFPLSSATATARWHVDPSGAGALWAGMPVMQVSIFSGGVITGPAIEVLVAGSAVTASFWLMLPADHKFTSCGLSFSDQYGTTGFAAADILATGTWQRVSASLVASGALDRIVTIKFDGQSTALMNTPLLTQCWQIEPGPVATSYIPSSSQVGVREADDVVTVAAAAAVDGAVDQVALNQAICRAIPAGSIAWTTTTS